MTSKSKEIDSCISEFDGILFIVDIDGSLMIYHYDDEELLKNDEKFDLVLESSMPFPKIKKLGFIKPGNRVVFITGRKDRHKALTERWIKKHFGIDHPKITFVRFDSKEQYVSDKIKYMEETINEAFNECKNPPTEVIIIEDDVDIIDRLGKKRYDFPFRIYKVDRKTGDYQIVYKDC